MPWFRSHPYLASLLGAVVIILLGMLIVATRSGVEQQDAATRVWSGVGVNLFNPTSRELTPASGPDSIYTQVHSGPPFYYTPPGTQAPTLPTNNADDFNFDGFLAMLSRPSAGTSAQGKNTALEEAYAFIPTGLLSTSTPLKERTPTQQALYNYGNEAGSYIETHEENYRNAPQILKDQFEDRSNTSKNNALLGLARSLGGVGGALLAIEDVPSQVAAAHERLGKSYRDLGEKLSHIPATKSDKELIDALLAYNSAVETYVKNYTAMATLFSALGVTFSADDPGKVFTFTQGSL